MERRTSMSKQVKQRKSMTPEGRQRQLVQAAVDLAEKKILDGTASSQVICHYLNLASPSYRNKREREELENELIRAKVENLKSQTNSEKLYANAIKAFAVYNGHDDPEGDFDDEDFEDY